MKYKEIEVGQLVSYSLKGFGDFSEGTIEKIKGNHVIIDGHLVHRRHFFPVPTPEEIAKQKIMLREKHRDLKRNQHVKKA